MSEKAQRVAATGLSSSYNSYLPQALSTQLNKHGWRMIAYACKMCGVKINRPTSDSSCSNLIKHASNCLWKQSESRSIESLAAVGIGGTGDIDPREVPQLCAVWCAEAARPFTTLVDASHRAILHPTVLKNLPARRTVLKDIHMMYSGIQQSLKSVLNEHQGALY
ncbi:hypothetical protein PSTG_09389 [Puccinia striiformis f. sp. tritici PST-78]|uniref:BED-type domain-containing protein n=1 Tax=Puccinia striiformis f. sp. tritici PST-78 TaxID=1165861 RepID=A0A0L0VDB3_9BASI|nr:hypothetical protein PSTG_09389 [Puccinia striiformis f. sp. tritici PST-78]